MNIVLLMGAMTLGGLIAHPSLRPVPNRTPIPESTVISYRNLNTDRDSTIHAEIKRMMDSAAAAWNRGDLDRFMMDYAPDTTTTFK